MGLYGPAGSMLCRKTRSGFERLVFFSCFMLLAQPLSDKGSRCCPPDCPGAPGAASTIKPISPASVPSASLGTSFARRKTARSRADDGVFRKSLDTPADETSAERFGLCGSRSVAHVGHFDRRRQRSFGPSSRSRTNRRELARL